MKGNWVGIGNTPIQCQSRAILSLDHMGRLKQPCCIDSAEKSSNKNAAKPICEECGFGCYSVIVVNDIKGK